MRHRVHNVSKQISKREMVNNSCLIRMELRGGGHKTSRVAGSVLCQVNLSTVITKA